MAAFTAILWGVLAIILKFSLTFIDALSIIWVRFGVAFFLLLSHYVFRNREDLKKTKTVFSMLAPLAGFMLAINYISYLKAVDLTGPGNVQILIQLSPLLLALSGFIIFKEVITKIQIAGFVMAALGFSLFYYDQLSHVLQNKVLYHTGNLWVLLAALSWVSFAICQKFLTRTWPPQLVNLFVYGVAFACFTPFANFSHLAMLSPFQLGILCLMGLNTLLAYGALGEALHNAPAFLVSIILALNPILTLVLLKLLKVLDLQWIPFETVSPIGYLGAGAVLTGAILVVKKRKK